MYATAGHHLRDHRLTAGRGNPQHDVAVTENYLIIFSETSEQPGNVHTDLIA